MYRRTPENACGEVNDLLYVYLRIIPCIENTFTISRNESTSFREHVVKVKTAIPPTKSRTYPCLTALAQDVFALPTKQVPFDLLIAWYDDAICDDDRARFSIAQMRVEGLRKQMTVDYFLDLLAHRTELARESHLTH
jgi:hypothetical protein